MFTSIPQIQTDNLLDTLREALDRRNFSDFTKMLLPFWKVDEKPDFSNFSPKIEAELALIVGEFLIEFGKSRSNPELIEVGKDTLTNASDYFWNIGDREKSFQCQMLLAIGYSYQGSYDEYQIFLQEAEQYFQNDQTNSVFLQIQVNYLILELDMKQLVQAIERVDKLKQTVAGSKNGKIKALFNLQAGIIKRLTGDFQESVKHFQAGLHNAGEIGSRHHQSLILNCLANTYRCQKNFPRALETIDKAIELATDNSGWLPHLFDTKANILLDLDNIEGALEYADAAVINFQGGEDYRGFCEALWTHCQILFRAGMPEMALHSFLELCETGKSRIGEKFVEKYILEFLSYNYFTQSKGLLQKIDDLKESQLRTALIKTDGKRTEAAQLMKIPHQYLTKLIKKFPRIENEFPTTRKPRNDRKK